jgi:hypothetical protein
MHHARSDYNCIQPWPTKREHTARSKDTGRVHSGIPESDAEFAAPIIPDDEPVLLLRAQDVCAAPTLRHYAELLQSQGADKELVDAVLGHADRMERWPRKKVPDADKAVL